MANPQSTTPSNSLETSTVPEEPRDADEVARAFLDDWVDDGRVVRRDQGDDTVSEGQAYGLLISLALEDEDSFDEIWSWTKANMVGPDGLLAWQWKDGEVVDDEPASDADLDVARALVLAGEAFERPELTTEGNQLAGIIAERMTVETAIGRILLPGMWAGEREPYAYNPSYASPGAFSVLAESTGDARWNELIVGSRAVTTALLDESPLPPDWAQVHADGTVEAMPGAQGSGQSVRYSYDAARLPLRYAESCDPADVALAAQMLPPLERADPLTAELDLGGASITEDRHPVAFAARAAAHAAAGDLDNARADLRAGDTLSQEAPTYYGAAWAALGYVFLSSSSLGACAPGVDS